jgi:hypothetical protein
VELAPADAQVAQASTVAPVQEPAPANAPILPAPKPAPAENGTASPAGAAVVAAPLPIAAAESVAAGPRVRTRLSWWRRCKLGLQSCFLGYPEEFQAPALGQFVHLHGKTMVANGDAARMVLYHYDFVDGSAQLNLRGKDQLLKLCALLPTNFYPVVIQRIPCNPALAEARRLAVLTELAQGPFPVPPERVVIGPSLAVGGSGREGVIIYQNLLGQTQSDGKAMTPPNFNVGGTFGSLGQGGGGGGAAPQSATPPQ